MLSQLTVALKVNPGISYSVALKVNLGISYSADIEEPA